MIVLWVLVLIGILVLCACTAVLCGAIEEQTERLVAALRGAEMPEPPLSAHGGTFTQLLAARAKAHAASPEGKS